MTVYYIEVATFEKTNAGTDTYLYIKIHGDTGLTIGFGFVDVKKGA